MNTEKIIRDLLKEIKELEEEKEYWRIQAKSYEETILILTKAIGREGKKDETR